MNASEEGHAVRGIWIRRNWSTTALLMAVPMALLGLAALFLETLPLPVAITAGVPLFVIGTLFATRAWRGNAFPKRVPARVEVAQGRIAIQALPDRGVPAWGRARAADEERIAREQITEGLLVPATGRPPRVRLTRHKGPDIELEVLDEEDGRALLSALGLDAGQSAVRFTVGSPLRARQGLAALVWVAILVFGSVVHTPFVGIAAALALLALFLPGRLDIGADGVLVSWLGRKRFVPYRELAAVSIYDQQLVRTPGGPARGLTLSLQDGSRVLVSVTGGRERAVIMAQRIRDALHEHRRRPGAEDLSALARKGRDAGAWVAALRGVGAGAHADARTAPVDPERLWRIAADVAESSVTRAAAATALGSVVDGAGRARLRAVADATVEPKLRIALQAAAAEDEAALAEALAELDSAAAEVS